MFLSVIFCEAVAIYGVIVAIILQTKLDNVPASKIYDPESLRAGYAIFASGIIVGFANLFCGLVSSSVLPLSSTEIYAMHYEVYNTKKSQTDGKHMIKTSTILIMWALVLSWFTNL